MKSNWIMKALQNKANIVIAFVLISTYRADAQVIPKFQFGIKAGANLSKLDEQDSFSSKNRAGSLFGLWARASGMGVHLQPELYYTAKTVDIKRGELEPFKVDFTSIDVPVLLGTKIGAAGFGARLNTGPVVSFIINNEQSAEQALNNIGDFRFKNQALAWQVGLGLDVRKLSLDLRYEHGLSKVKSQYEDTRLRLFNFSLGYQLY